MTVDNYWFIMYNKNKENKEPYLKYIQPLQYYIDAKNEFEKNATKNSNNKYKTAIIGGKEYQVVYPIATKEDLQPKMLDNSEVKLANGNYTVKLTSNKSGYTYEKKLQESADKNERSIKKARKSSEVILRNAETIKEAAKKYGVNPSILASCIYTEQIGNVNLRDTLTDTAFYWLNTSIGIGQVKVSTAKLMENKGYIEKTKYLGKRQNWHGNSYVMVDYWEVPGYGIVEGSREKAISKRLTNEKECIEYVAAYLKYWQDEWKDVYPEIDGRSAILGTLFNLGENAKEPNPNPQPNDFGLLVKENYYFMQYLLDLE